MVKFSHNKIPPWGLVFCMKKKFVKFTNDNFILFSNEIGECKLRWYRFKELHRMTLK